MGFEFWSETGDQMGRCSLIDDIPIEMGTSANSAIDTFDKLEDENDWSPAALGGRICFAKQKACHKYFGQNELNDVMLKCYCPDNRKGFYTKKVFRTEAATEFCGQDDDNTITLRIREAQANRMFHLCENWCLFNTQKPREESWYHDPWEQCWREQYAGVGTHRSYCNRVIRDPMTIEQYYIDERSANLCDNSAMDSAKNTDPPTPAPNAAAVTWFLASAEDSCDDECANYGMSCDGNAIHLITDVTSATAVFSELGLSCDPVDFEEGTEDWAFPGVGPDGTCIYRNPATTMETGCNWAIGVGYQRACACYSEPSTA